MTNQEMILHIADCMTLMADSVRHFAENMVPQLAVDTPVTGEPQPIAETPVSYEEVRSILAAKSAAGKSSEVKKLIADYGVDKLSAVDPKEYATLLHKAEEL